MAKQYLSKHEKVDKKEREHLIQSLEREMKEAAKVLDFERAAELRDIIVEMRGHLK
jgi:excinuclease ABC subunit B